MKNYKIFDTVITIKSETLQINSKQHELKKATFAMCKLFLENPKEIFSKDDLVNHIWKDIIVSDASVFKQIHLIKKLFVESGLPDDTIENIYGKGYRLKYKTIMIGEDKTSHNPPIIEITQLDIKKPIYKFIYMLLPVLVLFIGALYYEKNPNGKIALLSPEHKENINDFVKNDYKKGLKHIKALLNDKSKPYTKTDYAYLISQKGVAEFRLQDYENSVLSYEKALVLYQELGDETSVGQMHLNIATCYSFYITENSVAIRKNRINQAIAAFKKGENKSRLIDTQIQLAQVYRDENEYEKAIALYKVIIDDAKKYNDKVGEMIAINSLATTYLQTEGTDKAISLLEDGLKLTLEIGEGRYIASSYSLLSDIYLQKNNYSKALKMIQGAIKYSLTSKNLNNLIPKLFTYNFLLLQTYQYEKSQDLLALSDSYIKSLNFENNMNLVQLYKGIKKARQGQWQDSLVLLKESLVIAQKKNLTFKKTLLESYLSIVNYFNHNYVMAIEFATQTFENKKSTSQEKALCALALASSYTALERFNLADEWYYEASKIQEQNWLFEHQLFLRYKLEKQNAENSILIPQTEKQIEQITKQMLELAEISRVDEILYSDLNLHLENFIEKKAE